MTVTIDLGQFLILASAFFGTIAGFLAIAHFIKKWWQRPPDPAE